MEQEIAWKFESDIATEPRFNLRRWFERWVTAVGEGNLSLWQTSLSESLMVADLVQDELDREGFVSYLVNPPKMVKVFKARVSVEDEVYTIAGSWETVSSRLLIFAGEFEMLVRMANDNQFQIFGITFYPRLRVSEDI